MRKKLLFGLTAAVLLTGCGDEMEDTNTDSNQTISLNQDFREAAVHDPSIIYADDHYYVIGSHLAFAKSPDLMNWRRVFRQASCSRTSPFRWRKASIMPERIRSGQAT